jgi:hypothetical protein
MGEAGVGAMTSFVDAGAAAATVAEVLFGLNDDVRASARRFGERFSWKRNAEATAAVYRQALKARAISLREI